MSKTESHLNTNLHNLLKLEGRDLIHATSGFINTEKSPLLALAAAIVEASKSSPAVLDAEPNDWSNEDVDLIRDLASGGVSTLWPTKASVDLSGAADAQKLARHIRAEHKRYARTQPRMKPKAHQQATAYHVPLKVVVPAGDPSPNKVALMLKWISDRNLSDEGFRLACLLLLEFHNTGTGQCNPAVKTLSERLPWGIRKTEKAIAEIGDDTGDKIFRKKVFYDQLGKRRSAQWAPVLDSPRPNPSTKPHAAAANPAGQTAHSGGHPASPNRTTGGAITSEADKPEKHITRETMHPNRHAGLDDGSGKGVHIENEEPPTGDQESLVGEPYSFTDEQIEHMADALRLLGKQHEGVLKVDPESWDDNNIRTFVEHMERTSAPWPVQHDQIIPVLMVPSLRDAQKIAKAEQAAITKARTAKRGATASAASAVPRDDIAGSPVVDQQKTDQDRIAEIPFADRERLVNKWRSHYPSGFSNLPVPTPDDIVGILRFLQALKTHSAPGSTSG